MNPKEIATLLDLRQYAQAIAQQIDDVLKPYERAQATPATEPAPVELVANPYFEILPLHAEVAELLAVALQTTPPELLATAFASAKGWEWSAPKPETLRGIVFDHEAGNLKAGVNKRSIVNAAKLALMRDMLRAMGVTTTRALLTTKGATK